MKKLFYQNESTKLYLGNSLTLLKTFSDESFDVIITDPPYFLSNGGITCKNGEMVSVDKGEWDRETSYSMDEFNKIFLEECKRLLNPNGTIWVCGTMHNIFSLGQILNELDYKIINHVTWQKSNPAPNLSCRVFTHSTESFIWAKKSKDSKHYFNYELMKSINHGKQMKDVWKSSTTKPSEKTHGNHPTQKPMKIIERIVLASTKEDDYILDCFAGSGTTNVVAYKNNRNSVGIDLSSEYLDIARKRLQEQEELKKQLTLF